MKLFSLKKDNDSTAPTSEDANPSSQLAENPTTGVSDSALQLDTTNQPPMQATNYPDTSPNTSPETTAIKNAFSLDSIDLNQLEDELLHGKTDYTADNTKAADTVAPKKLSFNDFDLDELSSVVEPNTTVTIEDAANTSTVSQPVPSQTTDNALIFDIDNLPLEAKSDPDLNLSLESDTHSPQPQPISLQSSDKNSDKKIIETIETIEAIETTPPVGLTKTKPEIKAADTVAPKKLSFNDFDLDELSSVVEPNTTVTIEDAANTSTVSQPVPSQTTDNALIFDIDNLPLEAKSDPDLNLSLESDTHSPQPQPISLQSSDKNSDKKIIETIETIEAIETTPPVGLTKTKPEIKAVIAQTPNPFLRPPSQTLAKRMLKKRNQLGLLVGAGLALAALAWFFMGQSSEPNKSTAQSQTQTQAHATPKTAAPIVKPQASASLPTASTVAVDATTSSAHATAALPAITPEEILTPTLPEDPALAKEELSRLSEQSAQLKEQETMMQDQLRMMNELSSKKEERIQLLEQQVAQLEQQKAANK